MQNKVKLSKRQIKEDKFTTFMLESKQQFLEHWQTYVIGIVGVVLVVAAVVYYFNAQQTKEEESAQKFARALLDYRNGNNQIALLSLNQIITDYSGSEVAGKTTFLLGKINYESKNYSESIRYFEQYVKEYRKDKFYLAAALAGIGACHENQGNYAEAAQKYNDACEAYPDGPMYDDYNLSAVRCYMLAGNRDAAKKHLDILNDKFKGTTMAARATRLYYEKEQPQPQS